MRFLNMPVPFEGEIIEREEACRLCEAKTGKQIGKVDYWDIKHSRLVQCENCGLIQLDPMLSQEETARGCLAYYVEESLRTSQKELGKNLVRNFRNGFLLGMRLKNKGFQAKNVLEFGPGTGYFSEGVKHVFPDAKITVMDVNKEVLMFNKKHHGYDTIESNPETHRPELDNSFDLIIARDLLEHVIDIGKVLQNVKSYAAHNALFHFITPNGHEDVWKHYLTYNHKKTSSELLINHVNYFDGKGLLDHLVNNNFTPVSYYTYKLKTTRRGRGWKVSEKLMAPVSEKKDSGIFIEEKINELKETDIDKDDILNKWYISKNRNLLTYLISLYHHGNVIRLSPKRNIGHEIYGLFEVTRPHRSMDL